MTLLKSFKGFISRVLNAVRGKLGRADFLLLQHLLIRTRERNLILARGLLTALKMHSPKKEDIQLFAKILDNANIRIIQNKEPFTEKDEKIISNIFAKYGLSQKVADWVASQRDIFLYHQIKEVAHKTTSTVTIPKIKKKVVFETKKKKKKITS